MVIFYYIALFLMLAGSFISFERQAQMLQQNSYFLSRYGRNYIKGNFSYRVVFSGIALILSAVFTVLKLDVVLFIFSLVCIAAKYLLAKMLKNSSIKPLSFTKRVLRQYISLIIVNLVLIVLAIVFRELGKDLVYLIITLALIALCYIPALSMTLIKLFNEPFEKFIGMCYRNSAKKIIDSFDDLKVIGVTGSFGKTSVKHFLYTILNEKFNTIMTPGSFNTTNGVVITIRQNLKPSTAVFIAEMGAKNVGDIREICNVAKPNYGIISSVGPMHLETFKTMENVQKTKFELFDSVKANGGVVYANGDSEYISGYEKSKDCILYGKDGVAGYDNVKYGKEGSEFDVTYKGQTIHIKAKLLGMHNIQNLTGCIAIAMDLGMTAEEIAYAVTRIQPVEHRLQIKVGVNNSLELDDAYNANPVGSARALETLGNFDGFKKIIVTPGFVELGEKEEFYNRELGKKAAEVCDEIILVGAKRSVPLKAGAMEAGFEEKRIHIVNSFNEAMTILSRIADEQTVILLENDLPDSYLK